MERDRVRPETPAAPEPGLAETFNRRQTIADYLDEVSRAPGADVTIGVRVTDPAWAEDWRAALARYLAREGVALWPADNAPQARMIVTFCDGSQS